MNVIKQKSVYASFLVVVALSAMTVQAKDNSIYVGAGVGGSTIEAGSSGKGIRTIEDEKSPAFKAIIGIRPLNWLAFEVNYLDFGTIRYASASNFTGYPSTYRNEVRREGVDAYSVFLLNMNKVDLFVKLGGIKWRGEQNASFSQSSPVSPGTWTESTTTTDESGHDKSYGFGIQMRLSDFAVRLEYENFDFQDFGKTESVLSAGLTWAFL